MNILIKTFKHIKLVCKHRWLVFKFCTRLGMPFRGLMHDLSKFSPIELVESIKYYDGKSTPISRARKEQGYSKAWLHHKKMNKHHEVYWIDLGSPYVAPVIPYKYVAEMICDKLSACITYNGKNWTNASESYYWEIEKTMVIMNPKVERMLTEVFNQVKDQGINKTIRRKNIKKLYKQYCIDDTTEYKYVFSGHWEKKERN